MNYQLLKKNGFTLIEVLGALGLTAIIAYLILPMAQQAEISMNQMKQSLDYNNSIRSLLYRVVNVRERSNCAKLLQSDKPIVLDPKLNRSVVINSIGNAKTTLLQVGKVIPASQLRVNSISIEIPNDAVVTPYLDYNQKFVENRMMGFIEFQVDKLDPNNNSILKSYSDRIVLNFSTDKNNILTGCYGTESVASDPQPDLSQMMCEAIFGNYNEVTKTCSTNVCAADEFVQGFNNQDLTRSPPIAQTAENLETAYRCVKFPPRICIPFPNAQGEQSWSYGKGFSTCQFKNCDSGYYYMNRSCVAGNSGCFITNSSGANIGLGVSIKGGPCTVQSCYAGYILNANNNSCDPDPNVAYCYGGGVGAGVQGKTYPTLVVSTSQQPLKGTTTWGSSASNPQCQFVFDQYSNCNERDNCGEFINVCVNSAGCFMKDSAAGSFIYYPKGASMQIGNYGMKWAPSKVFLK